MLRVIVIMALYGSIGQIAIRDFVRTRKSVIMTLVGFLCSEEFTVDFVNDKKRVIKKQWRCLRILDVILTYSCSSLISSKPLIYLHSTWTRRPPAMMDTGG